MSPRDSFWFIAGALVSFAAALILGAVKRRKHTSSASLSMRQYGISALATSGLIATALAIYIWIGSPESLDGNSQLPTDHARTMASGSRTAGSLEDATRKLAARLETSGGSADEWQLLEQSHAYLGKSSPAAGPQLVNDPDLDRARQLRRARDFESARAAYAQLAKSGALTADAWADYADTVASLQDGRLTGEPERYIAEALRIEPRHPKALWLAGTLAHEQRRFADALAAWRAIQVSLPANSPDQRIIAANIEEASRLAASESVTGQSAAGNAAATSRVAAGAAPPRISGTVVLADGFAGRAPQEATLFIYAKQPAGSGPPLAVLRLTASDWPVSFVLDDSTAMIAGRGLSTADRVSVEARISLSGNALPQRGDLVGTLASVDPRASGAVRIAIDREIS